MSYTMSTAGRERLIAEASLWSGFCTDHNSDIPSLASLSAFLLDVKHQMALDRPADDEWCREEECRYRHWRSGGMPTHKRGRECPLAKAAITTEEGTP